MLQYSLTSLMVFAAVAKARSFSEAARALYMTQPGVSTHIAHLEAQTGLKLIRRDGGGLTKEGKVVYRYAEKVEKLARAIEDAARALRKDAMPFLRIATTPNYGKKIMPYVLGDFQRRNPEARIKLDTCASAKMHKTVLSGQNDVVIAANPRSSKLVRSFPFMREELVAVAASAHPLASKKEVSLADIQPYPFIIREEGSMTRSVVLAAFTKTGVVPTVLIEANNTEFIKEWVSQSKGVSILIRSAVNCEEDVSLTAIPLQEPLFLEVAVLYLKSKEHDPCVQRFIGYLRDLTLDPGRMAALGRAAGKERTGRIGPASGTNAAVRQASGGFFTTTPSSLAGESTS